MTIMKVASLRELYCETGAFGLAPLNHMGNLESEIRDVGNWRGLFDCCYRCRVHKVVRRS